MNLAAPLLVASSYLLGSFPTAYLAGRFMKGIDIREYGSGNVGASNVSVHVSRLASLAVGPTDFPKGILPVWAARRLDLGLGVGAMAGLAAMVGHSWSLYLGFKGGRGISVGLGVMAMIAPLEFLLNRLLFDRDVRDREEWIRRLPSERR